MLSTTPPRFTYLNESQRQFSVVSHAAAIFREATVFSADEYPLTVYTAGSISQPTVLLVAPLGISCAMLANLADHLLPTFHVLTWEGRGLSGSDSDTAGDFPPDTHLSDMKAVLGSAGKNVPEHIVSYCSGAYSTLYGAANGLFPHGRMCLVSPPIDAGGLGNRTNYQKTFLPLLDRIAVEGVRFAALVRAMLDDSEAAPSDELMSLNNMPFSSAESTYCYARLHAPWRRMDWAPILRRLSVPMRIVHGNRDAYIHPDSVHQLAGCIARCSVDWIPDAGHFGVYDNPVLLEKVSRFLTHGATRTVAEPGAVLRSE